MFNGRQLLAEWIARARVKKGEAAAQIGISASELSHLLSGRRRPTLPLAVDIEEVTGIPAASWVPTKRGKSGTAKKPPMKSAALA